MCELPSLNALTPHFCHSSVRVTPLDETPLKDPLERGGGWAATANEALHNDDDARRSGGRGWLEPLDEHHRVRGVELFVVPREGLLDVKPKPLVELDGLVVARLVIEEKSGEEQT